MRQKEEPNQRAAPAADEQEASQGFLSYAHADDEYLDGKITWLKGELQRAIRFVSGQDFEVFQDKDGIAFGQHWPKRLDDALKSARFLIPVLTPSYLASVECRKEANQFLAYEAEAGRTDLILPIYLSTAPILEDADLRAKDDLARRLYERQYDDWREIALEPAGSPQLKAKVRQIAESIAAASERANQPSSSIQEDAPETPAPQPDDRHNTAPREAELAAALAQTEEELSAERRRLQSVQADLERQQKETAAELQNLQARLVEADARREEAEEQAKQEQQAARARIDEAVEATQADKGGRPGSGNPWRLIVRGALALAAVVALVMIVGRSGTIELERRLTELEAELNAERQARTQAEAETEQARAQIEDVRQSVEPAAAPAPTTITMNAQRTREAQTMLRALGFYEGSIDGVFGNQTKEAISGFQTQLGGEPTGALTVEQWGALELAAKSREAAQSSEPVAAVPASSAPRTGETFRDCAECPEIVVISAGSFEMGSPGNEEGRRDNEGPQREVTIPAFALGKYEVTFGEWDACVARGGCSHKPEDEWGRARQPVMRVSWKDAQEYVEWLSGKTGESYRLPSEAEWEYAARAGTTTRHAFGDEITSERANFEQNVGKTTEVGSYPANAWGLHEMHGNVWEWVEDCWNESYEGAPTDGTSWLQGNCDRRVLRGGSWNYPPERLRSAYRDWNHPDVRYSSIGFRVARTVTP